MPKKLKPLTKAQLDVIDTVCLLSLAADIDESCPEAKGYKQKVIDSLSPKQTQIYRAIKRRSKRMAKQYVEWLKAQPDAN